MGPDEFAKKELEFCEFDGVSFLGGCCGTTPQHIHALVKAIEGKTPKAPTGYIEPVALERSPISKGGGS